MNAPSGLLVILLANQGYWFGGQEYTIGLQWVAPAHAVDAVLEWELMAGEVRLAKDQIAMPTGEGTAELRVTPPTVRVRTATQWRYRVVRRADNREIETGQRAVFLHPSDMLESVTQQVQGKRIAIMDRQGGLAKTLTEAGIKHGRLTDLPQLQTVRADIILVAPEELGGSPFEQAPILDQAAAGACVGVFRQPRAQILAGYPTRTRALPTSLEWRLDHPLLNGLQREDLHSMFVGMHQALSIQLPADEPALEVAWWPREVSGNEPAPIDALLVSKRTGAGRLMLCQLPVGSWHTDPRHRQLLANVIAYLATRPEPTPPPSRRNVFRPPATAPVPTITIPPGGEP